MQIPARSGRRAFTLMEVLLASAIALLILSGIYVAIDSQVRIAEEGRNLIDLATLARSLTARMTGDVAPCAGMADPARYRSSSSSSSSSGSNSSTSSSKSSSSSNSSSSSSSSSSSQSSSSTTGSTTTQPDQMRVFYGEETNLRVFVTRVPRSLATGVNPTGASFAGSAPVESDQKLVFYWLAGAGSGRPLGLARYEMPLTTAVDGLPNVIGGSDEAKYVIAPEVMDLAFSYYDAGTSTWGPTWNGADMSPDGVTPIGPPQAIRITFSLPPLPGKTENTKFEHVIAIPTANGATATTSDPAQAQDN